MTLKWMNQIDEKGKHLSGIGKEKMNTHTMFIKHNLKYKGLWKYWEML